MSETTSKSKKPRRWLRRLGVVLVAILILIWFAPTIALKLGLHQAILAKANAQLNGQLSIGRLSLGWFAPITLHDVALTDPQGQTVLAIPTIRSSLSLLTLAGDPRNLGTFVLESPTIEIECSTDTTNLETVLAKLLNDRSPSDSHRPLMSIEIHNGLLKIVDQGTHWSIMELNGSVVLPEASQAITIDAKGIFGRGSFEANVALGSEIVVKLKTEGFPLGMVAPIARRFEPGLTIEGHLNADVVSHIDTSSHRRAKAEGSIAILNLDLGSRRAGNERLVMRSVELPLTVTSTESGIQIERANLTCDVGSFAVRGIFDPREPIDLWLDRPGLSAHADLDLAKLATMFPKLLHVREGTVIREGRVTLQVSSEKGTKGTTWSGKANTSALRGVRNGQPLVWDQPLMVEFTGHLDADHRPAFEHLEAKAEFANISGSGSYDHFSIKADLSLDRLTQKLSEFLDLGGLRLSGTAKLAATSRTIDSTTTLDGNLALKNLMVAHEQKVYQETELSATLHGTGAFFRQGKRSLETANVQIHAGSELLDVRLLSPIPDLDQPQSGQAVAKLSGNLEHWVKRIASLVTIPKSIKAIGGQGTLGGTVTITPKTIALDNVTADLKNARFHGYGLQLDEQQLLIDPTQGVIHRETGLVEFPTLMVRSSTVAASVKPLRLVPLTDGSYGVDLDGVANANLARIQQLLQFQTDPQLKDRVDGLIASGKVKIRTVDNIIQFDADLPMQKFMFGPPQKPSWSEDKLSVIGIGGYDLVADKLRFDRAFIERPDGLKLDAKGQIDAVTTITNLDLSGQITYDLSLMESKLKSFFGKSFEVKGRGTRDFQLAGRLHSDMPSTPFGDLKGQASIGWQSLKAYGFDVGQSQLVARLDRGVLNFDPLNATFGQTGKIQLEPRIRFLSSGHELSFANGPIIEHAKLTPVACADAIGYVLPAFAKATETAGTISFDLDQNRVPLAAPEKATMSGRLTLHEVQVGPGPVISEIMLLSGAKSSTFSLNPDNQPQVVPVRLENGWIYHEKLTLATKNFTMTTSGRVSLNGELEMIADVPLPDTDIGPLLKNNPKLRDALAKKRIQLPVRGTIHKPKLDPQAFRAAVRKVTDEIIRDLGKNALGGLLDKIAPPPKK